MCGITGLLIKDALKLPLKKEVVQMGLALQHRGPDSSGEWTDKESGIALAHRRLSVIDLTTAGHQPMISPTGRYIVVYNGEIYNHKKIRANLASAGQTLKWHGHSDTETLLAAIELLGVKAALKKCIGMFAVAVWDRQKKSLSLARDRMGEKPLYLAKLEKGWAFASELKALHQTSGFKALLNHEAVSAFLSYGYVPENLCIFNDVQKVPPGGILTVSADSKMSEIDNFYCFSEEPLKALKSSSSIENNNFENVTIHMNNLLNKVIDEVMISDVNLGCFLSGGVDSSLIAALMQGQRDKPILTFSMGFKETRFNELPHAAAVAGHLKTDHSEFILSEDDALNVIKDLPQVYDEPFADSSQIPTLLLCGEARKAVTVALTGDGGDEIFGGYNRHIYGPRLLRKLQGIPKPILQKASWLIKALGPYLTREDGWVRDMAVKLKLPITAIERLVTLAPLLKQTNTLEDLYNNLSRNLHETNSILIEPSIKSKYFGFEGLNGSEWMMAMDSVTYLPSDILVKVDRAAMFHSLETRSPLLDARIIREAWSLPIDMKIDFVNGKGKKILRNILFQYVPENLIDRPKQGFSIPIDRWLRGALRDWGNDLISDKKLHKFVGLNQSILIDLWDKHQNKGINHGAKLWNILTLLDWVKFYQGDLVVD